jgi:hypothetical protein
MPPFTPFCILFLLFHKTSDKGEICIHI